MIYWNYRLVKKEETDEIQVCEVYYDLKGRPSSHTSDPISLKGENLEEVLDTIQQIVEDISEYPEILEASDFTGSLEDI